MRKRYARRYSTWSPRWKWNARSTAELEGWELELRDRSWRRQVEREAIAARVIAAVGSDGAQELLDILTCAEVDRAQMIGQLHARADGEWLSELLMDLEEDEPARLHLIAALRERGR